jgi:tetratricopeptide (TPR) repeat protein
MRRIRVAFCSGVRVAIALALVLVAQGAQGAPPGRRDATSAEGLREEADRLALAERSEEAVAKYDESYALAPNPIVLYNRGRALESLHRYPEALASLERFAIEAPLALRAKVPRLGELIADVRAHTTRLELLCNVAGARITLDGKELGTTPLLPVVVGAGTGRLTVRAEGYVTAERDVRLAGAGDARESFTLVAVASAAMPAPKTPAREQPAPGLTSRWWFWAGVGVVVAASAVGAYAAATTERAPGSGDRFSPSPLRF